MGNPDGVIRIAMRTPCRQAEGSLHLAHADGPPCHIAHSTRGGILSGWRSTFSKYLKSRILSVDVPPSLDISHPVLDAGWERRAFQLPRLDISESSDSAYPESFAAIFAQCRGVLLKLPDMCDQHFEIFFFRYLICATDILRYFALDI